MLNQPIVSFKFPLENVLNSLMKVLRVWQGFLDFLSGNKVSNISDSYEVAGSTVTLAPFDAFLGTILPCLQDNGVDNVDGHRQQP